MTMSWREENLIMRWAESQLRSNSVCWNNNENLNSHGTEKMQEARTDDQVGTQHETLVRQTLARVLHQQYKTQQMVEMK